MNRETIPVNHHYIPQYYLKGFCRSDKTFAVFDKQYSNFRKSPQSPATVLFEKNRNRIKINGKWTNQIETHYSTLESSFAQLFKMIRGGASPDLLLTPDAIRILKLHIAFQFWRLPRLDKFSESYLLSRTQTELEHLCSIVKPQMLPADQVFELIQTDAGFRRYFRSFWLPHGTFDLNRATPDHMEWRILDVENSARWSNHLCSDAPFIFRSPEDILYFSGPLIFPLTNSRLLVLNRKSTTALSFDPIVSTKISMLSYLQAGRYVIATDRKYLEKIIKLSEEAYPGQEGRERLQREVLASLEDASVI